MFRKILIANRGEIACRVIATAKRLGIATVAVYSEADAGARHTRLADEAWPIGPAPARQSYLVAEKILEVARRTGAEAIHPGYGFLSENAEFAAACAEAGIVFIGPPAAAIRAMGSKAEAKALMERSGVPLVPGYHGEAQDLRRAEGRRRADRLPGADQGLGRRRRQGHARRRPAGEIEAASRAPSARRWPPSATTACWSRSTSTRPRHIEIQVFADTHGNAVSLFERDCSIQRRHQKVLEEAPAPGMDPARRRAMGEAAVAAARAVGYVGAGTVEFIAEGDAFYFMEMNTRLQVEHPVTEMVTGLDLVEWQLRVAAGEPLPLGRGPARPPRPRHRGAGLRRGPGAGLPARGRHALPPAPAARGAGPGARGHRGRAGRPDHPELRPDDRQADRLGRGPPRRGAAAAWRRWRSTRWSA